MPEQVEVHDRDRRNAPGGDDTQDDGQPKTDGGDVGAVTAKRNAAGMVTVDVNGSDDDDDYAGGETNAGSSAWNSVTLTKTNAGDDSTDMVVIYTDIEAPSDKDFSGEYDDSDARRRYSWT